MTDNFYKLSNWKEELPHCKTEGNYIIKQNGDRVFKFDKTTGQLIEFREKIELGVLRIFYDIKGRKLKRFKEEGLRERKVRCDETTGLLKEHALSGKIEQWEYDAEGKVVKHYFGVETYYNKDSKSMKPVARKTTTFFYDDKGNFVEVKIEYRKKSETTKNKIGAFFVFDEKLYTEFKNHCQKIGVTFSERLSLLMRKDLEQIPSEMNKEPEK